MPEKTKRDKGFKSDTEKETAELPAEPCEAIVKDTWSADQKQRSYYYDDDYGYEIYNPDEEDEENDER
jgi:hypothetical protein